MDAMMSVGIKERVSNVSLPKTTGMSSALRRGKTIGEMLDRGRTDALVASAPGPFSSRPAERMAERTGSATLARAGQRVDVVGAVLSLIIVAVIAYVGLDVIGEVESSTDVSGSSDLQNASTDLDNGIESAFGLMGVVFLVILLSVVIGLFLGLR